jgi:hypothetical protein
MVVAPVIDITGFGMTVIKTLAEAVHPWVFVTVTT